jgi:hypothetical protein
MKLFNSYNRRTHPAFPSNEAEAAIEAARQEVATASEAKKWFSTLFEVKSSALFDATIYLFQISQAASSTPEHRLDISREEKAAAGTPHAKRYSGSSEEHFAARPLTYPASDPRLTKQAERYYLLWLNWTSCSSSFS